MALAAIIAAGLIWRRADLGLPVFWRKYGGSALWGAMVFVIVGIIRPDSNIGVRIAAASFIAAALEFSRLFHTPHSTNSGRRWRAPFCFFSLWNILAYIIGICGAASVEAVAFRIAAARRLA